MSAASWLTNVFNFAVGAQYNPAPTPIGIGSTGPALCDQYGRLQVVAGAALPGVSVGTSWYDPAALRNSDVIKASAGNLYQLIAANESPAKRWIMLFDATTVPSLGAIPKMQFPVASGSVLSLDLSARSRVFSTGIVWASSTTVASLTLSADVPGNLWVNGEYV